MMSGIHEDFAKEFEGLKGKTIRETKTFGNDEFLMFEMLVGNQRLCWEVAVYPNKGGRCFLMPENSVDGAGIFPLR